MLVSAGFDAHTEDPLAGMNVTEDGFRELARRSAALAPRCAAVLEGGYNLSTLPAWSPPPWTASPNARVGLTKAG